MSHQTKTLPQLGWSHFFQQQLSLEQWEATIACRVTAVHGPQIELLSTLGQQSLSLPGIWLQKEVLQRPTVGDWLLVERESLKPLQLLERKSLFRRKAAGLQARDQLIAANIDTLFIVTSCNQDFNLSRLERYLALAGEAGVEPVVIVTKADLVEDHSTYVQQARSLKRDLQVEAINACDLQSCAVLAHWCGSGQTVAVAGSSGVGKSTLINSLCGSQQVTAAIRDDDAKGRHTTTVRSLHFLPKGGILIDTPGMRELQLVACEEGIVDLFEEIELLARRCKFNDCSHTVENGCAVLQALDCGQLDPRRVSSYQKLKAEQQRNSETIAERRRREKGFQKMCNTVQTAKRNRKDRF